MGRPVKLWNDYEGNTIAEVYLLKQLLRPEGRSAFFATSAQDGAAEVIRITESLNDEYEMLERWRQVSAVHQANLVEIKAYGATTLDGVPLTYALLEETDGSLAEILEERPLTAAETMQVATSVMAALSALHAIGLVHEHLEPASVVAKGETVKLRSDCVRECRVDPEFNPQSTCDELRRRDVHDLAALLLQCLTLERQWTSAMRLPAPFDQAIRHGLEGTWGLAEMERALHTPAERPLVPAGVLAQAAAEPVLPAKTPEMAPVRVEATAKTAPVESPSPQLANSVRREPDLRATTERRLHLRRLVTSTVASDLASKRWLLAGAGVVLIALFAWVFTAHTPLAGPVAPEIAEPAVKDSAAASGAGVGVPAAKMNAAPAARAPMQPGWHVIAYTYLHEGQAAAKAATVARQHPGLNPKVFAPAGGSPYFVALGGGMSESEAASVLRTARRDGLPRDTFIRLYRSR